MKILVFGISGMLGHKVWEVLNSEFPNAVYGTVRKSKSELSSFPVFNSTRIVENVDIQNTRRVINVLDEISPDVIVNCTGVTLRKEDNSNVTKNMEVNGLFPRLVSMWARNNNSRFIHFSTDCVFDGKAGNYVETDYPTASDTYGVCKYLGEVAETNSLTLRVSIVGRELFNKTELVEWFLAQKGKTISGYSEVYYTGLTTNFLAREVVRLIKKFPALTGLYHISSEKISKYELLNLLNVAFDNNVKINSDSSKISDKSLNCEKYTIATGFERPSWRSMIQELISD